MWTGHVEPDPSAVSSLRTSVRTYLESNGVRAELENALVVFSEIVTNAVRHGRPPVKATVFIADNSIHIEVDDEGATPPVVRPRDPSRIGGNGMLLVEAFSQRWGTRQEPGDGKTVWADVACG